MQTPAIDLRLIIAILVFISSIVAVLIKLGRLTQKVETTIETTALLKDSKLITEVDCTRSQEKCVKSIHVTLEDIQKSIAAMDRKREQSRKENSDKLIEISRFMGSVEQFMKNN